MFEKVGLSAHQKQTSLKTSGRFIESSSSLPKATNQNYIKKKYLNSIFLFHTHSLFLFQFQHSHYPKIPTEKPLTPWFLAIWLLRSSSVSSVSRSLFRPFDCPVWTKTPRPRNDDNTALPFCPFSLSMSVNACKIWPFVFVFDFSVLVFFQAWIGAKVEQRWLFSEVWSHTGHSALVESQVWPFPLLDKWIAVFFFFVVVVVFFFFNFIFWIIIQGFSVQGVFIRGRMWSFDSSG